MPLSEQARYGLEQLSRSYFFHPRTQEDRNMRLIYLSNAIYGIAAGGLAFLPVFLARLGASPAILAWFTSAPALLSLVWGMPAAVIAERYPDQTRVRTLYGQAGRVAYLLCALAPFFVPVAYLPVVLVLFHTLRVLPESVDGTAFSSLLARGVSPRRRAQLNGTRWAIMGLMTALSSVLFGLLLDRIVFPLNFQLVLLLATIASVLDIYFFAKIKVSLLERPAPQPARSLRMRLADSLGPVLRHRPFTVFVAATVLLQLAMSLPSALLSLFWVNQLRASNEILGLRSSVHNAAGMLGCILWARAMNHVGRRKAVVISSLLSALYPILTALAPSALWLLPVAALFGLAGPGTNIALFDLLVAACPEQRQPLFLGISGVVSSLATFAGPLLGAALAGVLPLGTVLILAGLAQALTLLPLAALPRDI